MNKLAATMFSMILSLCCCLTAQADEVVDNNELPSITHKYEAIALCVNDLTEHEDWSSSEAYLSLTNCEYGLYEKYLDGTEPVWVITFTDRLAGDRLYFVLGREAEWIAKIEEDEVLQNKNEVHYVSRAETSNEKALPELYDYYNSDGDYFYNWTISEKASFSSKWRTYIKDLVLSGQLDREWVVGEKYYQWTRRMYGVPSASEIAEDEALARAFDALHKLDKPVNHKENYISFFDVTDYRSPQWRFYIDYQYAVIIDAKTGEILFLRDGDVRDYDVDEFMMQE